MTHDESCDMGPDCSCDADDEWLNGATWADDIPLACGIENPEECESCQ